jgi:hypothetical protein
MLGYQRYAFADGVREEVYEWITDDCMTPFPEGCPVNTAGSHEVYMKPTPPNMRKLLQWWGTEYRRAQDPNYWTKRTMSSVERNMGLIVITDVRFPNEERAIHERGGTVWRIIRPGHHGDEHISEKAVDQLRVDATVPNDGTLLDLADNLLSLLTQYV